MDAGYSDNYHSHRVSCVNTIIVTREGQQEIIYLSLRRNDNHFIIFLSDSLANFFLRQEKKCISLCGNNKSVTENLFAALQKKITRAPLPVLCQSRNNKNG